MWMDLGRGEGVAEYGIKRHIFNFLKMNEFNLLLFLNPKLIFKHVPSRDIDSYAPERQRYNTNKVLDKQRHRYSHDGHMRNYIE